MATRLYSINKGQKESQTVSAVGPGNTTGNFEVQIDLTQFVTSADVQAYLDIMMNYIIKTWHP